jgi:hypothetical protein
MPCRRLTISHNRDDRNLDTNAYDLLVRVSGLACRATACLSGEDAPQQADQQ